MRPADLSSDDDFDEDDDMYFSVNKPFIRGDRNGHDGSSNVDEGVVISDNVFDRRDALHRAAEKSDIGVLTSLLEAGVDADDSDELEWTPLMKACSRGNYDIVEFLISRGADPNAKKDMFTPIMACCVCSYVQEEDRLLCLKKLIENGAEVNAQDKFDTTALMTASGSGLDSLVAELLMVPDIDINLQDKDGWTALFYAVNSNCKSIALRLVKAGINLNAVSKRELTAFQFATARGFAEIMDILAPENENDGTHITLAETLVDFLNEMPNEKGEGGFCNDVRDIFLGLGLEKIYDKCKINIGLQDFLVKGEELDELGIELEPLKWKIKVQGIHRYHVYPWKKSSLHTFEREDRFTFEDAVNCLANVTKHLTVMYATLVYLKQRIPKRIIGNNSINKEVITNLVNAYVEIENVQRNLTEITKIVAEIPEVGMQEADLVEPKKEKPRRYHYYLLLAGSITAFLYYKLR